MKYIDNKAEDVKIAYIGGGSRGWAWGLMSDLATAGDMSGRVELYDIDFEILNTPDVKNIICAGPNAYDIATRLILAGYPSEQIYIFNNLTEAKEAIDMNKTDYIFGILNFDYVEPFKATFTKKEEV